MEPHVQACTASSRLGLLVPWVCALTTALYLYFSWETLITWDYPNSIKCPGARENAKKGEFLIKLWPKLNILKEMLLISVELQLCSHQHWTHFLPSLKFRPWVALLSLFYRWENWVLEILGNWTGIPPCWVAWPGLHGRWSIGLQGLHMLQSYFQVLRWLILPA